MHTKGTTAKKHPKASHLHEHKKHIAPILNHPMKEKPMGTKKDNLQTPTLVLSSVLP